MSPDDADERLSIAFDELIQDSRSGSSQQRLEEAIRKNPDLEKDLRELFATAQFADDVAILQSSDLNHLTGGSTLLTSGPNDRSSGSAIGSVIGDYELKEEIGRGGMGVVYRATQISLQRTVALKMIPNAAFASTQDLARLRAEALAAARLSHPNIVPVYEVGEHHGQPWFSMKFIEGSTLSKRLMDGPMAPREAVAMLLPIVEAIGAAHRAGVLHRDVKPSNIMIASDGTPFVTDFGLAKRVSVADQSYSAMGQSSELAGLTQSGAILGTPAWMSPEQAAGQTDFVDVATDVYSLGAVLFAMLTGRPPFQSASPLDTILMVLEQDPPNIRMLNRGVDSDLEMVVMKCLQKPTDLRYASTVGLADDLRAWLCGEPVSARSSTFAQIMMRLFRESHHAAILQNWGLLWMWHSLVVLCLCLITNYMQYRGVTDRWPYVSLWVIGLGLWAGIFWNLRHRAGPITAVERQIAHVWGGSMIASSMLFWIEMIMERPVLEFSPVLGAIAGMVFLVKAGMLSGSFYIQSAMMFATSLIMAAVEHSKLPDFSISLFGIISALTFFTPGLKYYRQQKKSRR